MDFISELIDDVIEIVVEERWLPIVGYEGLYEVSDLGRVKSLARTTTKGGIRNQFISNNGYLRVPLTNLKTKKYLVHRIVLSTFLPIEENKEVDHINHIKTDNRFENLRWATCSENTRHRKKLTNCSSKYIGVCFDKSRNKWLSSCKIYYKKTIGRFDTEEEAAKAYNAYIIENGLQDFAILN